MSKCVPPAKAKKSQFMYIIGRYFYCAVPLGGYLFGKFLDDMETLRMTMYRDKSQLYGRTFYEDDDDAPPPSWPTSVLDDIQNLMGIKSKPKPKPKPKQPEEKKA